MFSQRSPTFFREFIFTSNSHIWKSKKTVTSIRYKFDCAASLVLKTLFSNLRKPFESFKLSRASSQSAERSCLLRSFRTKREKKSTDDFLHIMHSVELLKKFHTYTCIQTYIITCMSRDRRDLSHYPNAASAQTSTFIRETELFHYGVEVMDSGGVGFLGGFESRSSRVWKMKFSFMPRPMFAPFVITYNVGESVAKFMHDYTNSRLNNSIRPSGSY